MGADGCLFAMLVTKMDEFVSSRYIGAGQAVHSGQLARSKSAEGCGSPAATSKGRRHFEAPTEPTGETSSLHWARVKTLPSDMMLCVISYWVYIIWRKMAADPAAPLLRFSTPSC